jgi:microcystin-dependent protein
MPVGMVMAFTGTSAPPGWLLCDGTQVSRTQYADLFAMMEGHGTGDGAYTFHLPNYVGRFHRMIDNAGALDFDVVNRTAMAPGGNAYANLWSVQTNEAVGHNHTIGGSDKGTWDVFSTSGMRGIGGTVAGGYHSNNANVGFNSSGGSESRPENASVIYCIKY